MVLRFSSSVMTVGLAMTMVRFFSIFILAFGAIAWVSFVLPGFAVEVSGARSLETLEEIDRQLESDPLSETLLRKKVAKLHDNKDYHAVIQTIAPLLRASPNSVCALEATAKSYIGLNEYVKAIGFLDRWIEEQPCFNNYYLRAACLIRIGRYKLAEKDEDVCICLHPDDSAIYIQKAECYRRQFGIDEHCENYMRKAYELSKNDPIMQCRWNEFQRLLRETKQKSVRER